MGLKGCSFVLNWNRIHCRILSSIHSHFPFLFLVYLVSGYCSVILRMSSLTLVTARPPLPFTVGAVLGGCKGTRLDTSASLHFTFFFLTKPAFCVALLHASHNSTNRSLVGREQDGHYTYKLTLKRVRVTIVTVEKQ